MKIIICGRLWGGTTLTLLGELTALPQTPYLVGRGLVVPLPKNPSAILSLRPQILPSGVHHHDNFLATPLTVTICII